MHCQPRTKDSALASALRSCNKDFCALFTAWVCLQALKYHRYLLGTPAGSFSRGSFPGKPGKLIAQCFLLNPISLWASPYALPGHCSLSLPYESTQDCRAQPHPSAALETVLQTSGSSGLSAPVKQFLLQPQVSTVKNGYLKTGSDTVRYSGAWTTWRSPSATRM